MQYDWKEANRVLTICASSMVGGHLVFKAYAPPLGVRGNLISALKLLANLQEKESFIDVVYDGIKKGSSRNMVAAVGAFQ